MSKIGFAGLMGFQDTFRSRFSVRFEILAEGLDSHCADDEYMVNWNQHKTPIFDEMP